MIRSGYHDLWDAHMHVAPACASFAALARAVARLHADVTRALAEVGSHAVRAANHLSRAAAGMTP